MEELKKHLDDIDFLLESKCRKVGLIHKAVIRSHMNAIRRVLE